MSETTAKPDRPTAGAQPLFGIRVIDLTQVYSGPYATFLMARAGADVIKVEPPGGESLRRRRGQGGAALPFAMLNPNKRCVTLDLKNPRGRDLLLRLARTADVLVENFRPGVMDRLGLGDAALHDANPRLVRASVSGFGSSGRYRDYPAMDLTVQAASGLLDSTGHPDQPPTKAGAAIVDFLAGTHLYGAILTALFHRERTGEALPVEVAMLDAVYPALASNLALAMAAGPAHVARTGNRHGGMSLCPYNVYPAADGHVAIICNDDAQWRRLIEVLGRPDLATDARSATNPARVRNMDWVDAEIGGETARLDRATLFARLNEARVLCGPVRTLPEVLDDPHLRERGMVHEIDHPEFGHAVVCNSPLRFAGRPATPYDPSRALGADTEAVLAGDLRLSTEEIAELRASGVI